MPEANGSQPGAERVPDELAMSNGEMLKQSLADDAGLDEDVISVKLALDVVAVLERGMMEMLIAAVAAQRLHVGHPEMVGEGTDLAHCLLEGVLDLEAQAVETNDIDGVKGSVCAHEEAGTSRVDGSRRRSAPAGRRDATAGRGPDTG